MEQDRYREESWNIDAALPSPEDSTFIIDIGNYMIKTGFSTEEQPRLKILNLVAKNKNQEGNIKIGSQIQYIELLKQTVQHPFQNSILVQVTLLQQILTGVFEKVIGDKVTTATFPYKTLVIVPYGQPQLSLEFLNDLFLNCFNCKNGLTILKWDQIYQKLYDNAITIHLGHVHTDVYSFENTQLKQVKRISIGQQQLQTYFRKLLACSYGSIVDSIPYTQLLDFIYQEGKFLSTDSQYPNTESYQQYNQLIQNVNDQIQQLQRQDIDVSPLTYEYFLQNSINAYKLYSQIKYIKFLQTDVQYSTLYNQNSLVSLKKMVEKYQKQTLQKLLNLIKPEQSLLDQLQVNTLNISSNINENKSISEANSNILENQSSIPLTIDEMQSEDKQKFLILLNYLYQQLAEERRKQNSLNRNHIQTLLDHVLDREEYQSSLQVIDIQKLTQYQSNVIENLQFAFDSTLYLLRWKYNVSNTELPKQLTKYSYLPLAYHYENIFCNEKQQICVPIFLELIYTLEMLFNTQQFGLQQQSLDEIINEFLRDMNGDVEIIITGGGANIKNIDKRVLEVIRAKQRIKKVTVQKDATNEWQMIVKALKESR